MQKGGVIAVLHMRIANIRKDFLHKVTTKLCRENETLGIEDLHVKGMLKNHRIAFAISDVGFGEFRRQLTYKSKIYGNNLVIVNRWFPSSKTCSNCGHVKQDLTLKDREYVCTNCGIVIDRDLNAAINLNPVNQNRVGYLRINASGLESADDSVGT
jgi:putative transposase